MRSPPPQERTDWISVSIALKTELNESSQFFSQNNPRATTPPFAEVLPRVTELELRDIYGLDDKMTHLGDRMINSSSFDAYFYICVGLTV